MDADSGEYFMIEPTVGRNDHQSLMATKAGVNLSQIALYDALDLPCGWAHSSRSAAWVDENATARHLAQTSKKYIRRTLSRVPVSFPSFATLNLGDLRVGASLVSSWVRRLVN